VRPAVQLRGALPLTENTLHRMQIDFNQVFKTGPNGKRYSSWDIRVDGVVVDNAPVKSVALAKMDAIWAARPEADRELERQYMQSVGDDR
jgi:hypothetical protein